MEFKEISLADYKTYSEYYKKCMTMCADTSFYALFGRSFVYKIMQAFERDFYWNKIDYGDAELWLPPVGDWDSVNWEDVLTELVPAGTVFSEVPEYLVKKWQAFADRIVVEEARGSWDYIYSVKRYVELTGSEFKSLRHTINSFKKRYNYTFDEMRHSDIEDLKDFQARWMQKNEAKVTEDLACENQAIHKLLDFFGSIPNMLFRLLRVEGKIVAYTIIELYDENLLCVLCLKGDKDYVGSSALMQHLALKELAGEYLVYNACADVDLEGLRKNKTNENPITLYKKYTVTWKG